METSFAEKDVAWRKKQIWDSKVHLQPKKPTVSRLHQKKCDQQLEGGNSAPLLYSRETPPSVSHSALGLPVQERHTPVREGEENHENDQKAWSTSPVRKSLEIRGYSTWRTEGSTVTWLQHLEYKTGGERHFPRPVVTGQGVTVLNRKRVDLI